MYVGTAKMRPDSLMPRRFASADEHDQHEPERDAVLLRGPWNCRDRDDRGDAGRDRHRDGEDVVDEQRRARDQRRVLAEVLAADDVAAAAARVGEDRLAVRRDDDREQDRDRDRDRDRACRGRARGSSAPTAMTKRISSVAYAVDEIASDENTASAIVFGIRWCSCSVVASGRPTRTRLTNASVVDPVRALASTGRRQHAIPHGVPPSRDSASQTVAPSARRSRR